jgi:hypothetical protein
MEGPVMSVKVDFNAIGDDGILRASRRFMKVVWGQLEAGQSWVLARDGEGNTCQARIEGIHNMALDLRPDWRTWMAGSRARLDEVAPFVARSHTEVAAAS